MLRGDLLALTRDQDRLVLTFRAQTGVVERLVALARRESECCPFLDIDLIPVDQAIQLRVVAPPEASEVLDAIQTLVAPNAANRAGPG